MRSFLLTPPQDGCNEACGYCFAKDHYLGECVKQEIQHPNINLIKLV